MHGPNGFLRQFKGSTAANTARPDVRVEYEPGVPGLVLYLSNVGGSTACTVTVADNAYGAAGSTVVIGPSATVALKRPLGTSFGWYDLSIRSSSDSQFLRRIAGHVETGGASRTDPQIGTNRSQQAALSAKAAYVQKGSGFALAYAAPVGKLDAKNWIGVYGPGTSA
ncbi:DUF756 domain-containing protein [Massilia sp. B-10]|nr:DUF756 domain-containing protein [Massilia sp. B-10]UUZ52315.1 DUF756 domain-containing protein [Massilia sp. H-1]